MDATQKNVEVRVNGVKLATPRAYLIEKARIESLQPRTDAYDLCLAALREMERENEELKRQALARTTD